MAFDFNTNDRKWQKLWEDKGFFHAKDDYSKPKFFGLIEFPYPSGNGLHVGHPRSNTAMDIICRKKRMEGYNVLFPIGWDAFGLPTENYAIKTGIHPSVATRENINRFREQLQMLGFSFDYTREVDTTDPNYYKWTQWIFLQFFKKGLAYKKEMPINWCKNCKIGLANEEVVNGTCDRCDGVVEKRTKNQWMLKITEYAEKLINDLDEVNYLKRIKMQQTNWIGKSTGALIDFEIENFSEKLTVFTTRPDTIYGATYMVLAPEHPYVDELKDRIENFDEVESYRQSALTKSDLDRTELNKDKTGVLLKGIHGINPVSGEKIPLFISDYVLITYGTGSIMAVPGHDQRDWEFAKKFNLPIIEVIQGGNIEEQAFTDSENGILINSPLINGLKVPEAIEKMISHLESREIGQKNVNYKLRDWVFSRQRYWGEPIPIVICDCCGFVPVPDSQLPLTLPVIDKYDVTDTGESPLSKIDDWVNTICPACKKPAKRETDTMPQWAGSSWYYLRYIDPHNSEEFASKEKLDYWLPVDWYNGGMEHTTLHLLYSRFWNKFLYDCGHLPNCEPYQKRTSHGMILGEDNQKMSKSRGNVINPDDIVKSYGADAFRTYEMFMGAFDKEIPWSTNGLIGVHKFLERVFALYPKVTGKYESDKDIQRLFHKTIRKVTEDIEDMKFNTAISAMMILTNELTKQEKISKEDFRSFLLILSPFAPHIAEELWEMLNYGKFIPEQKWPSYDPELCKDDVITYAVQVLGKLRATIEIDAEASEEEVVALACEHHNIQKYLEGKNIVKKIFVKGKLLNLILK